MKQYFMPEQKLSGFVAGLMEKCPVIAPVAKRTRFVFDQLQSPDELRLDYDTTILPPKKVFFPTSQDLVSFSSEGFADCIEPRATILFGVHPHDIKGIAMADKFYEDSYPDSNYLAHRRETTIIGTNVVSPYKHAFFGSAATEMEVSGHDLFLTSVDGGYVVDVITDKGEALLAAAALDEATEQQAEASSTANKEALDNCPEKLKSSSEDIRNGIRNSFDSDVWSELSADCFSCGSCNTVCPTCFCFDVQDEWNVDCASGVRRRTWDACLTAEFSEVSVQGGCENFREHRAERFRHRFMRKTAYLNEQLGAPACIGCGRCSGACTAKIANPTEVINSIMERK